MSETKQFKLGDRVRLVDRNNLSHVYQVGMTGTVATIQTPYLGVDFDDHIGRNQAIYAHRFELIEDPPAEDPFDKYRAMGNVFSYGQTVGMVLRNFDDILEDARSIAARHRKDVIIYAEIARVSPKPIEVEVKLTEGV